MLLDSILLNKDDIINIFKRHGASNITIVGSVARRQEHDASDIDFVADLKRYKDGTIDLQAHTDLVRELATYFERKIHLTSYEQILSFPPSDALKEGVVLDR